MKANRKLAGNRLAMVIAAAIATASFSANAFDVPVHVRMTNDVVKSLHAQVGGEEKSFSPKAMTEIANANEAVDDVKTRSAALWHPERHFTNEEYAASSQRLLDLRKQVINFAKVDHNGSAARVALGHTLHTMQDFYAHSNWIDRGNYGVNSILGTGVLTNPSASSAPCPDDPNLLGAAGGGSPTSYYFVGGLTMPSDFGCNTDELPAKKCFHGNYTRSCIGLNKDLDAAGAARENVPQNPRHADAALAAKHNTRLFIDGILDELAGDDKALTALLDVRGTLAFVIDNTGSMGNSLNGVKQTVSAMVAEAAANPDLAPENYLLEVFGDPYISFPLVTNNAAAFQSAVSAIYPNGGGDCPEFAQSGLIRAIDGASPESRILLFSDATSKDSSAINQVIASAQAKGDVLVYELTGSCSPTDPAYIRGAAETGGQVFRVNPSEIPLLYDFIRPQLKGKMGTIARRRIDLGTTGTDIMPVPVDSTMSDMLVAVSIAENNVPSHQSVQLIRPSGVPVSPTDPDVKIVTLSFGLVAYVKAPEPGVWHLRNEGYGPFTATVQGNSAIDLARFDFVEPSGDLHGGFHTLAGQPVAGEPGLGQASVLGPIASAQFTLIDEAGVEIGPVGLTTDFPRANPEKYLGEFPLPATPFRVEVTGVDDHGVAYQRQYPAVYRAQPVQVQTTGFPDVSLVPGEPQVIKFTVKNLGAPGSFRNSAIDPRGYVQVVNPTLVDLASQAEIEVSVTLMAPVNAADGDQSEVTFTSTRTDSTTTFNSATTLATVIANSPPVCPSKGVARMWPPNGQFASIDLVTAAGVTDPDNDPVTLAVRAITQDEPVSGPGFGNTTPDGRGVGSSTAELRAERAGTGNGRVYAIRYEATDSKGAQCTGVLSVGVPHNQGDAAAIDDGQNFQSTGN